MTPSLVAAIVACALSSVPAASAQDKATSGRPAMCMDMGHRMSTMQTNMKDMQALHECMAMGGEKTKAAGDMMKHHQMMESRIGMMAMTMEQMLQHMQMMQPVPSK